MQVASCLLESLDLSQGNMVKKSMGTGRDKSDHIIASFAAVKLVLRKGSEPKFVYHTLVDNTKTYTEEQKETVTYLAWLHNIERNDTLHHVTPDVVLKTLTIVQEHAEYLVFWDTRQDVKMLSNLSDAGQRHGVEQENVTHKFKFVDIQPAVSAELMDDVPEDLRRQTDKLSLGIAMVAHVERVGEANVPVWFLERTKKVRANRDKIHSCMDDAKAVAVLFFEYRSNLMHLFY